MSGIDVSNAPPTWSTLYERDTVMTKDTPKLVGLVVETWHEIGNDQRDVDEDLLRPHSSATGALVSRYLRDHELPRGYVIIAPLSGVDPNIPLLAHESALTLLDRSLTFAETVKRSPTDSISGTVISQGGTVDVRHSLAADDGLYASPDGRTGVTLQTIKGVSIEHIRHSGDWKYGEYVVWKNCWLGIVEEVVEDVTIRLDEGSVVTVEDATQLNLIFMPSSTYPPNSAAAAQRPPSSRTGTNSASTQTSSRGTATNGPHTDQHVEGPLADRLEVGNWVSTSKGNLRRGRWRYGAYNPNQPPNGIVVDVSINSLCINWLCQNMMVRGRFVPVESPDAWQVGETTISELKRFKLFMGDGPNDAEMYQIGDRIRFKDFAEASSIYNTPERQAQNKGQITKLPREWMLGYDVNTYVVIGTESWVQVQWQDTTTTWEKCTNLCPYDNQDEHDVWPGDLVITRTENADNSQVRQVPLTPAQSLVHGFLTGSTPVAVRDSVLHVTDEGATAMDIDSDSQTMKLVSPERVGVVQKVNANERIAHVRWFEDPKIEIAGNMVIPGSSTGKLADGPGEDVSLYEVSVHPALAIKRADLVLVAPEQSISVVDQLRDQNQTEQTNDINSTSPSQAPQQAEAPAQSSLQWMVNSMRGIVDTGLITNLSASLANTTSPQFQTLSRMLNQLPASVLGAVPAPLNFASSQSTMPNGPIDWFGEVVDLGFDGLVTVRLGALDEIQHVKIPIERLTVVFGDEIMDDEADLDDSFGEDSIDGTDSAGYASMDDDRWISEQVFYEGGERKDDGNEADWLTDEEADNDMDIDEDSKGKHSVSISPTLIADPLHPPNAQNGSSGPKMQAPAIPSGQPEPEVFSIPSSGIVDPPKRFLVLEGAVPNDHAFATQPPTAGTQVFLRRVAKEHKILNSSLPEGILVRTWENRMDLIRVLIIGPKNTPYELAPFLFDFHLGDQFPTVPPNAYFHSWTNGIGRVNPNLYEDGKICLSLLGTWHAERKSENWTSSGSSLLQVLISLMALVLVREPYYNEAGFGVYVGAQEAIVNSALYSEKAYILSRGFVKRVLQQPIQGFEDEIRWLYFPSHRGGLSLLSTVIDHARNVVVRSEKKGNPSLESSSSEDSVLGHEGLTTLSAGALVLLKRTLGSLEDLVSKDEHVLVL